MIDQARQRRVLDALQEGTARSWNELKNVAKLKDDELGSTLGELLARRLIWTTEREGLRVYGIERRTGQVPRFANQQRRATDLRQEGGVKWTTTN